MGRATWTRAAFIDSLTPAARDRLLPGETLLAVGAGLTDVGVQTEMGLGWWLLAVPITAIQIRRRLSVLSKQLGWSQPLSVGVVVTSHRVMIFRRGNLPPALAVEIPTSAVTHVERPTVGGYIRTLSLDLSEGRSLTDAMHDGLVDGMQTFDDEIEKLWNEGIISKETAMAYASNPTNLALRLTDEPANAPKKGSKNQEDSMLEMLEK